MGSSATDVVRDDEPGAEVIARLPVTDSKTWLGLVAIALLLAAGLTWVLFGRTPETLSGSGMIVPTNGFIEVGAPASGTVTEVTVAPGQAVSSGDTLVRLSDASGMVRQVTAPADGLIATVLVHAGNTIGALSTMVTIDPTEDGNIAVAFVPADQGTRITAGMQATIAPASVPKSEFGTITGSVTSVAALPVTSERIRLLVGGDEQLPAYYLADGPMVEVAVSLDTDDSSPSGYAWSFGSGPAQQISTGTLAEVTVVLSDGTMLDKLVS